MCLNIKYFCASCRQPISKKSADAGEACQFSLTQDIKSAIYEANHAGLIFRESLPFPHDQALAISHTCATPGCAYNAATRFTTGNDPEYGPLARCPGCDNIISVPTHNLSNAMMGGLQRFIAHRADARVPVLDPSLWAGYRCGSSTNGCLWTADQVLSQENRLNAIRQFINNNPQGAAAPAQVLGPLNYLPGNRPQKMWSRDEVATVKEMLAAGKDFEEIGARLGRTDKSVQAKVIRMAKKENLGGKKWAAQLQQRAKDEETEVEEDNDDTVDADGDYEDE
ncbi:hypothetical protein CKAH01_02208 [Colletotrichum kahawae]|uniref:Uncharacterized protein n=1 Tax=Colletotrichum kahawae TaxID=34407 RepID=A0AAD9Y2D7_COLKA|nr:hypothetical protein CKAH01_02208 [Colletotrichum kahawae]